MLCWRFLAAWIPIIIVPPPCRVIVITSVIGHGLYLIVMAVCIESKPGKSDDSEDADKPFRESSSAIGLDYRNDEACKHNEAWNHSDGYIGPPLPVAIKTKKDKCRLGPPDDSQCIMQHTKTCPEPEPVEMPIVIHFISTGCHFPERVFCLKGLLAAARFFVLPEWRQLFRVPLALPALAINGFWRIVQKNTLSLSPRDVENHAGVVFFPLFFAAGDRLDAAVDPRGLTP